MALNIVLLDGKVQRDTEWLTDMALYVKVILKTPSQVHEGRTQAIKGGKDSLITWNERMIFQDPAIAAGGILEFFIMDKDLISDDHVANGVADIAKCGILTAGVPNVYTIQLYHKGVPAGQLRFESVFQ